MAAGRPPGSYGPDQLARYLGLTPAEFQRARREHLIGDPDLDGRRWSARLATEALDRADDIHREAGGPPDLGAARAAHLLTDRLGIEVAPDTVAQLARAGHLTVTGTYEGYDLYDGRDLAAFTDQAAADAAERAGHLLTATAAATHLGITRHAFTRIVQDGRIHPAGHGRSTWHPSVPLYRTGDLDTLTGDDQPC